MAVGAQLGASSKVLVTALPDSNVVRCLVAGFNAATLSDGEILRLFISVDANAAAGIVPVRLTNVSATSPEGTAVPVEAGAAGVDIQSGTGSQLDAGAILNGASFLTGPISPGEIITLFASFPSEPPTIFFSGTMAPVLYADSGQVNAIVPLSLNPGDITTVEIRTSSSSTAVPVPVTAAAPAIFASEATGIGPGAILNQDYSVNSLSNPARGGSTIMVYGTGFGILNSALADGQIQLVAAPTIAPVTATIDGVPAEVSYAGAAPGLVLGTVQINVRVPDGLGSNPAAKIVLSVGPASTQDGVTVAVQ